MADSIFFTVFLHTRKPAVQVCFFVYIDNKLKRNRLLNKNKK